MPSICRNIGSTYDARDFIHGEKRELFQRALTEELRKVCQEKNVDVLLALVREIEVHAPDTAAKPDEVTEDLKRTIQESYIAIENFITMEKQREAAVVRAELGTVGSADGDGDVTAAGPHRVDHRLVDAAGQRAHALPPRRAVGAAEHEREGEVRDAGRVHHRRDARLVGRAEPVVRRRPHRAPAPDRTIPPIPSRTSPTTTSNGFADRGRRFCAALSAALRAGRRGVRLARRW